MRSPVESRQERNGSAPRLEGRLPAAGAPRADVALDKRPSPSVLSRTRHKPSDRRGWRGAALTRAAIPLPPTRRGAAAPQPGPPPPTHQRGSASPSARPQDVVASGPYATTAAGAGRQPSSGPECPLPRAAPAGLWPDQPAGSWPGVSRRRRHVGVQEEGNEDVPG